MSGRYCCRQDSAILDGVPHDPSHATDDPTFVDPRMYGFVKAAYGVGEALELLSIGRTSLYGAVRRGELTPAKFGKRTLFYAIDLAVSLTFAPCVR